MRQVEKNRQSGFCVAESEGGANPGLAFDRGPFDQEPGVDQEPGGAAASEARATHRFVAPALWGLAVAGGALAVVAVARLARRRSGGHALVRIVVEPPSNGVSWTRAAAAAGARLVIGQLLSSLSVMARESLAAASDGPASGEALARANSSGVQRNAPTPNGRLESIV